jgi:hypothetical protein
MARAFRDLRTGRHLCVDDGETYQDIRRHEDQYVAILHAMGYRLTHHPQNFYYISGGNQLNSKGVKAITLFLLVLFQHLEDNKFDSDDRSWQRDLANRTFKIAELPHFATSASRMLMRNLDITEENLREKVLRLMSRLGILELLPGDMFAFRAPVYRFVDLCVDYAERPSEATSDETLEADSEDGEGTWEDVTDDLDFDDEEASQ